MKQGKWTPDAMGLYCPNYKHAVDVQLTLDHRISLPPRIHPIWTVIELCRQTNKSIDDCVALVVQLCSLMKEGKML